MYLSLLPRQIFSWFELCLLSTSQKSASWSCPRLESDSLGGTEWQHCNSVSLAKCRAPHSHLVSNSAHSIDQRKEELIAKVKLLDRYWPHTQTSRCWKIMRSRIFKLSFLKDILVLSMATHYCLFPQHCFSIEHLALGPSPSQAVPCHTLANSGSFFLAGELVRDLTVLRKGYACNSWCIAGPYFWFSLTLSQTILHHETLRFLKSIRNSTWSFLAALYCWSEQSPISMWHISQVILLKLEKKGFNFLS